METVERAEQSRAGSNSTNIWISEIKGFLQRSFPSSPYH